ncbi:MAG: disulfide oxidoreductase [Nanoarchaeota archaeon]
MFSAYNAVLFSFLVALIATVGSLFFSEIALYEPGKLCWLQRIFMYPLAIILGIALYKKIDRAYSFILPLSFIGFLIALYHYGLQVYNAFKPIENSCSAVSGASCATTQISFIFGFVTIPFMALSAFLLIIVFMNLKKISEQRNI